MDWDDELKEPEPPPEEVEERHRRAEAARDWLEKNSDYKPFCTEW